MEITNFLAMVLISLVLENNLYIAARGSTSLYFEWYTNRESFTINWWNCLNQVPATYPGTGGSCWVITCGKYTMLNMFIKHDTPVFIPCCHATKRITISRQYFLQFMKRDRGEDQRPIWCNMVDKVIMEAIWINSMQNFQSINHPGRPMNRKRRILIVNMGWIIGSG